MKAPESTVDENLIKRIKKGMKKKRPNGFS
jgi:hypothetical protein